MRGRKLFSVKHAKEKPRTSRVVRGFLKLTVAGGFGGSSDDQSSLIEGGKRNRCEESQRGGDAEKLGHLRSSLFGVAVRLNF